MAAHLLTRSGSYLARRLARASVFTLFSINCAIWGLLAYGYYYDRKARRNAVRVHGDRDLNNRIRRALLNSRVVSNPRAICVRSHNGYVDLSGDVFWSEIDKVVSFVSALYGVKGVNNRMRSHQSPRGISALQGRPYPAEESVPVRHH